MGWSEEEMHRWLARGPAPRGLAGSRGDDAAVLGTAPGRAVLCVDQTVEGVHFSTDASPGRVGRKAAARVLSDLAATAAQPRALLVGLRAPAHETGRRLKALLSGVRDRARAFGADLVGGDLCCAPGPLALTVTGFGSAAPGRPPGRDRVRAGDVLVLTGPTGGASLGRHLDFLPRVREGRWLFERGARALMDVSDGLALDLERMARASGVRLEVEQVPVHAHAQRLARSSGRAATWHALHDGEDHELIAALPPRALARVRKEAPRRCPALHVLGRARAGRGLWLPAEQGGLARWRRARGEGFTHGG